MHPHACMPPPAAPQLPHHNPRPLPCCRPPRLPLRATHPSSCARSAAFSRAFSSCAAAAASLACAAASMQVRACASCSSPSWRCVSASWLLAESRAPCKHGTARRLACSAPFNEACGVPLWHAAVMPFHACQAATRQCSIGPQGRSTHTESLIWPPTQPPPYLDSPKFCPQLLALALHLAQSERQELPWPRRSRGAGIADRSTRRLQGLPCCWHSVRSCLPQDAT